MRWFRNLKTRSKLLLGFGLLIVLMGVVIVDAYKTIESFHAALERFYAVDFRVAVDVTKIRSHQNHQRVNILEMLLAKDRATQDVHERSLRARVPELEELQTVVGETLKQSGDTYGQRTLEEGETLLAAYRKIQEEQITLIHDGHVAEAQALGTGTQAERYERINSLQGQLVAEAEKRATTALAQAKEQLTRAVRTFLALAAVALLITIVAVFTLNRLLATPLGALASIARRVAEGDLTVQVEPEERSDEIGILTNAFGGMIDNLKSRLFAITESAKRVAAGDLTVRIDPDERTDVISVLNQAFGRMFDSLKSRLTEITETANVLLTATTEISATTAQLAASTTETATAVAQTSTTAQEVKQTAQLSTQKAQSLAETAQKAATVSQEGRKHTSDTVTGMNRIREQMDAIAETIVRLGEQSQAIGEIMGSVTDLAEQSNLLAVNAAIEAAKAGEQGKGFAVVAQEIKNLAEQSKQATVQVRTILNDVQKAISTAVMATDQGGKVVETGAAQATRAGEAIDALAGSVTEASNAAVQIAASSQQQTAGMDQMAAALDNIKQASTQNADSTRQMEQAAHNLAELGRRLLQTVSQYRV